ncbi:MAG TPA: CHAT domain-containing protein, partial [Polyangiales bacterium]
VLGSLSKGTRPDDAKAALQHLDTLLLGPLRAHLSGVSHIILSPDGKLNLVPFDALVDSQGRHEIEDRLISYVTSGRDLLGPRERRAPRSPVTIVAAPHYGDSSITMHHGGTPFLPLPGALAEATTLTAHFAELRALVGRDASKDALAAVTGPGVLHIATHAFYARKRSAPAAPPAASAGSALASFALPELSRLRDTRGITVAAAPLAAATASLGDPSSALDRAGLALAGANLSVMGLDGGIATAREIAGYDWRGTKLVVLSACDTGIGAVPSGEGVFGLRRALALAGAESQVVSLWNVNDTATSELMRVFYGELARGTGRAEALRQAKLALLRQPQLAHPYYWAAFISIGDWTPLDP